MKQRQIFGVGGNFFMRPWQQPTLQRHLLGLAGIPAPRICLLAGASGDNPQDIELFYRHMNQHECRPFHLSLANPVTLDFEDYLLGMNILYIFGGATRNLIAGWREWGMDRTMRAAWEAGVILSGTSAGSICWFESCITDSFPPVLMPLECLGLLKGSACTHYDTRPDRPGVFCELIASGAIHSPGIATDDDTAIHYVGDALHEVVAARRGATAYRIERTPAGYAQCALPARYIGC